MRVAAEEAEQNITESVPKGNNLAWKIPTINFSIRAHGKIWP